MKRKVEIEGNEAVMMPNGQSFMAEGPSHENGGIPIELPVGTRVYSKRIKKDGVSMAKRKERRDRDLRRAVNNVMDNPFDAPSEAAMRRIMGSYALGEADDMNTMEKAQAKKEAEMAMGEMDSLSSPDQMGYGGKTKMKCGGRVKKYAKGGSIEIDPAKRGTFKAQATRMGMSIGQAADYILANPDEFSPKMRKKANFARNFAMAYGGRIMGNTMEEGGEVEGIELEDVINQMIDARLAEAMGQAPPQEMEDVEEMEPMDEGEAMEQDGPPMEEMPMDGMPMMYGGKLRKMADGGMVGGPKVTHQLAVESPDGKNWFAFPMVDYDADNKKWVKFEDPWEAFDYHQSKGTLLKLPSKDKDFAMYYGREGLVSHGGAKDPQFDAMAQKINKENSNIPWVNRGMNPGNSPALMESEFKSMPAGEPTKQKMAEGGTVRDGATKRSDRKGKKMAVYMDGKWHHFGDSSMEDYRTHKSEKRREAFYSRHKKNLQGDDARSKAFRVYARKTWANGGEIPMYENGTPGVPQQQLFRQATATPMAAIPDPMGGVPFEYTVPQNRIGVPGMGSIPFYSSGVASAITPMTREELLTMMPAQQAPANQRTTYNQFADPRVGDNTMNPSLGTPITLGSPSALTLPTSGTVPTNTTWMQGQRPEPGPRFGTRVGNAISNVSQFVGANMGPLGIAVSTLGPLAATIVNRLGDKTNESFYEDFGRQGLAANARAMRGVEAGRQQAIEDVNMQRADAAAQARGARTVNSARGIQQLSGAQAMRASTVANQQAVTNQSGLMGQRASLLDSRDRVIMDARQAADVANVEDRDQFYTNLAQNLTNLGTGMMYAAKNRKPAQTAAQKINAKILGG